MLLLGGALGLGLGMLLRPLLLPAPTPRSSLRLDAGDLARATEVLARRQADLAATRAAAVDARRRMAIEEFVRLQAAAADMELTGLSWAELPAEDVVVPVELLLTVQGAAYDLPIFVDGLYRQAAPVELREIALEAPAGWAARVRAGLRMRFARPARPDPRRVAALADGAAGPTLRVDWQEALLEAASLTILERFDAALPGLREASDANRRAVAALLPGLLRGLAGAPGGRRTARIEGGRLVERTP